MTHIPFCTIHRFRSVLHLWIPASKGKRKKPENDGANAEEVGCGHLPLPRRGQLSDTASTEIDGMGRTSTAPSVAETASEGDGLMAVITEGEVDGTDVDAHGDDGELSITYPAKEQSADHAGHPDSQVLSTCAKLKPLQACPSLTSTILDGAMTAVCFLKKRRVPHNLVGYPACPGER